jgi:hypothetical protein
VRIISDPEGMPTNGLWGSSRSQPYHNIVMHKVVD